MKIALPNNNEEINQHFGRSTSFVIASVNKKEILEIKEYKTLEYLHKHNELSEFLKSKDVSLVIAGGIGIGASSKLEEKGIKIIKGAKGKYIDIIKEYLNGTLESKESTCKHGGHHHDHNH